MKNAFDPKLNVTDNLRQVAAAELDAARSALAALPGDDPHDGIHAARKAIKRLRALLRLARPVLGKPLYRRENVRLRDAARRLSAVRDARALIDTFDTLAAHYAKRIDFSRMLPLRTALAADLVSVTLRRDQLSTSVAEVVDELEATAAAMAAWPLDDAAPKALARGLGRTHRRARKEWRQACEVHDPETLHAWRKRAKYLRHMYELMDGLKDAEAADHAAAFHALGDVLGEHHDLEVLRARLDALSGNPLDAVAESELRVVLRERQDALYAQALELGAPLLSTKPKKVRRFVREMLEAAFPG